MLHIKLSLILLLSGIFLLGCSPTKTGSTYKQQEMGRTATVIKGTVVSMREVDVSGTNDVGKTAGAGAGAVAGANIGGNTSVAIVGAIVGAVIGGVAGSTMEESITEGNATEFMIEQENGQIIAIVQTNEENLAKGDEVLILRSDKTRIVKNN